MEESIKKEYGGEEAKTTLRTADGEVIRYTVCNRFEGMTLAGLGGLFLGMVSTGLGELNGFYLLQRCKIPSKVSVATSVFIVAITALLASSGYFLQFLQGGREVMDNVMNIVIFSIPGVIIGGQLGSRIASRIPQHVLERGLGILLILVAIITLFDVVF
jgi:uncharacterized membrane protein YfcA